MRARREWFWRMAGLLGWMFVCGRVAWGESVCVVVDGHPGAASFAEAVEATGRIWMESAGRARCRAERVGLRGGEAEGVTQKQRLKAVLERVESPSEDPLWLVLTGHGSAQGQEPRFQLDGEDLGLGELKEWLGRIRRPMVVVLGFSSSGAFVKGISAPGRVVVSATRSGEEENWSRFGKAFATALTEGGGDLDGDGQVSVFEAWWAGLEGVEAFYKENGRLSTEHAVLEDLGEGRPVGKEAFEGTGSWKGQGAAKGREVGVRARGVYWIASPVEAALTAGEREQRAGLEKRIGEWKGRKDGMERVEYERGLEGLLVELAQVYEGVRRRLEESRAQAGEARPIGDGGGRAGGSPNPPAK
jgi:hypothetical protein